MLLLTFTLNQIKFGIPLEEVEYIVDDGYKVETSVSAKHIRGTAILRGEVVPIYHLSERLAFSANMKYGMLVVVDCAGKRLGLEVESIDGIKYMEEFILAEIPPIIRKDTICLKHAISYQGELILVLDVAKLITEVS